MDWTAIALIFVSAGWVVSIAVLHYKQCRYLDDWEDELHDNEKEFRWRVAKLEVERNSYRDKADFLESENNKLKNRDKKLDDLKGYLLSIPETEPGERSSRVCDEIENLLGLGKNEAAH